MTRSASAPGTTAHKTHFELSGWTGVDIASRRYQYRLEDAELQERGTGQNGSKQIFEPVETPEMT
ncbi:MAG TPA: hypothetical protein VIW67_19645 [Terriglobales bacterium]